MDSILYCGANNWLMAVGSLLFFGVLILAAIALIKFLFSSGRGSVAA